MKKETSYNIKSNNGIINIGDNATNNFNTPNYNDIDYSKLIRSIREVAKSQLKNEQLVNMNKEISKMEEEVLHNPRSITKWKGILESAANVAGIGGLIITVFEKFGIF